MAAGSERLIFVSTDKAADPTSVLGASKHLAEVLVRAAASTQLLTASVRFGNVLGSRGSFLHTLAHQMRQESPVTVTHPDVERYFMSIPEAASLVVEASVMARAGEVYVLDMGDPVKIVDLVRRFARAVGSTLPEVRVIGLREGEKLSEDLTSTSETWLETTSPKVWRVQDQESVSPVSFASLYRAALRHDEDAVRRELLFTGHDLHRSEPASRTLTTRVPAQRHAELEGAAS